MCQCLRGIAFAGFTAVADWIESSSFEAAGGCNARDQQAARIRCQQRARAAVGENMRAAAQAEADFGRRKTRLQVAVHDARRMRRRPSRRRRRPATQNMEHSSANGRRPRLRLQIPPPTASAARLALRHCQASLLASHQSCRNRRQSSEWPSPLRLCSRLHTNFACYAPTQMLKQHHSSRKAQRVHELTH